MPSIKVYARITPNVNEFRFMSRINFDTYIDPWIVETYSLDNARLINNILSIRKPQGSSEDFTRITYVREDRDGFVRYYHVRDVQFMGDGKYVYSLSVDLWATYAYTASYKNMFVQRCNRFCGFPSVKLDNIENATKYAINDTSVDSKLYLNYTPLNSVTIDDVYIVFAVDIETYKTKHLFNGTITATDRRLFAIRPKDCMSTAYSGDILYLENAINLISSIYGIRKGVDDIYDANVAGLWIVPRKFLGYLDSNDDLLPFFLFANSTIPIAYSQDDKYINGLKALHYSFMSLAFDIENVPNKTAYFGTKTAMLELPRTLSQNGTIKASIETIVKKDGVQIIARCGNNQLDITESFSVGLPNSQGELKPEEKIARGVQTIGALAGATTQMAAGNYFSGVLNGFTAILPQDKSPNAMYKSNGDGLTSWTATKDAFSFSDIEYPVCITYYESAKGGSENRRLRLYGAIVDQYINENVIYPIEYIMASTPIDNTINSKETFLQAVCEVEDVPIEAENAIKTALANGVHLWRV